MSSPGSDSPYMTASEAGSVDGIVSAMAATSLDSSSLHSSSSTLATASTTPLPRSPSRRPPTSSHSDTQPFFTCNADRTHDTELEDPTTPTTSDSDDSFSSVLFAFDSEGSFCPSPSASSHGYHSASPCSQPASDAADVEDAALTDSPDDARLSQRTPSPLSPLSSARSASLSPRSEGRVEGRSPTPDSESKLRTADLQLSPTSSYSSSSTLAAVTVHRGLDHAMLPDVFETIVSHCSVPVLLALRCTSKSVSDIVEPWLYGHIEVYADSDGISLDVFCSGSDHRLPFELNSLWRFTSTQAIDLHGPLPDAVFSELAHYLTSVQTVYLFPDENGHCVDRCPILTSNLVVVGEPRMPRSDPGDDVVVMETRLQRVIIQVESLTDTNGLWYHQLLYPYGTDEVVLVMTGWSQPFTPYVAARGRSTQRRDSHLSNERFQQLCRTIAHFITKQANSCGYTRCVLVDLEKVDPEWFGVPEFVPLERHLEAEVREALGHWRTDEEADHAAKFLQFYTAAQWQAALAREDAERAVV